VQGEKFAQALRVGCLFVLLCRARGANYQFPLGLAGNAFYLAMFWMLNTVSLWVILFFVVAPMVNSSIPVLVPVRKKKPKGEMRRLQIAFRRDSRKEAR